MAGRGPAPKPANKRARRNADATAVTILQFEPCEQPPLPKDVEWPERTRALWAKLGASPLTRLLTELDWEYLLDTMILHLRLWADGDTTVMAELRLRLAKFFVTPEDRARGRIILAEADEADQGAGSPSAADARARRAQLRAIPSGETRLA